MLDDITFCVTPCEEKCCRRNLRYNKPNKKYISMCDFDKTNSDIFHKYCEHKLLTNKRRIK